MYLIHFHECALACITERKGRMSSKDCNSGQFLDTLCKYGKYLQATSEQKNWMVPCDFSASFF